MPGLAGFIGYDLKSISGNLLDKMLQSMKHEDRYLIDRYSSASFHGGRIHLGVFNAYPQPIHDESEQTVGFLDGKLYESLGTAKNPQNKLIDTLPKNDLETCLQLYRDHGIDFVKLLNGSFTVAIYDEKRNRCLIVTDRFGLRPMFYFSNKEKLVFASEIKAILQDTSIPRKLDKNAIIDFFHYGEILGNRTFFESIKILPPAAIAEYRDGKFSCSSYWNLKYNSDRTQSRQNYVKNLTKTFSHAIRERMKNNFRYGLSLSGGLDSRTILAEMKRQGILNKVLTFTHSVPKSDELKIAKKVASIAGAKHKEILLGPGQLLRYAENTVYRTDGMANILHCYILDCFDKVEKDIDIFFHGLAGDLLLGGSFLNDNILNATNEKQLFHAIQKKITIFTPDMLSNLFTPDFLQSTDLDYNDSLKIALSEISETETGNKADSFFLQNHVRRFTRLGGVLYRSKSEEATPTFDYDFFDLILSIPPELRKNHVLFIDFLRTLSPELARITYVKTMAPADSAPFSWEIGVKLLSLKRRFRNLILKLSLGKKSIVNRHYFVNFDHWFRTDTNWHIFLENLLLSDSSLSSNYFRKEFVEKCFLDHMTGRADNTQRLALLATFELFLRMFCNSDTYRNQTTSL